ncbi:MAG: glucuronate isomerase, partial [Clostridiales bacterium]|nr:glucuronate isomerase [Clostridiales bacterium]
MSIYTEILKSQKARAIFGGIETLPVIDFHCHLSPREIYEDRRFDGIADMWLKSDHYKWRIMRQAGIEEKYITGNAGAEEKFGAFVSAVERAHGNPLKDWARLELAKFFGIDEQLNAANADNIRRAADNEIIEKNLSPKKLISGSSVKYIATTDDPADTLEYHKKIKAAADFDTVVAPTYRADNAFNIMSPGFASYRARLSEAANIEIDSFSAYISALDKRMSDFKEAGCAFADVGTEFFPSHANVFEKAEKVFDSVMDKKRITPMEFDEYLGFMYTWWLSKCAEYGFIVQLHLGVLRNTNEKTFIELGADSGYDTVSDAIPIRALISVLNAAQNQFRLPKIILYTLNPSFYYPLITLAGSFEGMRMGVPWWFNDHKKGLAEYFDRMSELSNIENIPGMVTDSRSFLSYARHDYFRMVLADYLSKFDDDEKNLSETAKKISYFNMKKLIN